MLPVLPPPRATNFRVSKRSKGGIYLLQHGKIGAHSGGNAGNKQSQLAKQHLLCDNLQENFACQLAFRAHE